MVYFKGPKNLSLKPLINLNKNFENYNQFGDRR